MEVESRGHRHGDGGGEGSEEEPADADQNRARVECDPRGEGPGRQHDDDADDSEDETHRYLPERRFSRTPPKRGKIEDESRGQQKRRILNQSQEGCIAHRKPPCSRLIFPFLPIEYRFGSSGTGAGQKIHKHRETGLCRRCG